VRDSEGVKVSDAIRSIVKFIILVIILFAALAILVSPEFAQLIAIIVVVMAIAGIIDGISRR
jgi:membrane glycosyltransferase